MADRHVLYKHGVKAIAQAHALSATFIARPFTGQAGSGCHVHRASMTAPGGRCSARGTFPLGGSFLARLLA